MFAVLNVCTVEFILRLMYLVQISMLSTSGVLRLVRRENCDEGVHLLVHGHVLIPVAAPGAAHREVAAVLHADIGDIVAVLMAQAFHELQAQAGVRIFKTFQILV